MDVPARLSNSVHGCGTPPLPSRTLSFLRTFRVLRQVPNRHAHETWLGRRVVAARSTSSALTVTLGLSAAVYGMIRAPEAGWDSRETLLALGGASVLLVAFVISQGGLSLLAVGMGWAVTRASGLRREVNDGTRVPDDPHVARARTVDASEILLRTALERDRTRAVPAQNPPAFADTPGVLRRHAPTAGELGVDGNARLDPAVSEWRLRPATPLPGPQRDVTSSATNAPPSQRPSPFPPT